MTIPIVYNPTALAVLNGAQLVDQQQIQILNEPLERLTPGTYSVAQALPMLPVGPLRDTALSLVDVPGVQLSYRMVPATAGGPPTPQYFFREASDVLPAQGLPRITTGGPGGTPAPEGAMTFSLGGATLLVGANVLLYKSRVPAPLIGPAMGGSFAVADFLTGSPAGPTNTFLRTSFSSMGIATTANYGWAYGLDALGVPMGTSANTVGSIGGTLFTFAVPMTPKLWLPIAGTFENSLYSPTFVNAFRSAAGVGLVGAAGSNPYVFLAQGGPAGGYGFAGGGMQAVGAVGAVLIGSSLGGWITEEATGMNDENNTDGQLARMARDRMYSDAWGFLGRSPLGHLMAGLTVACGYSDEFAEGMGYAANAVARDKIPQIQQFSDGMNSTLAGLLINSASDRPNQPMNLATLEEGIRTFYQNNQSRFALTFLIVSLLRRNHDLPESVDGMLKVVGESGTITDRRAFTAFATNLGERELRTRTSELEARFASLHLTIGPDGQVATESGAPFTQEQSDFLHGDGARLSSQMMRLTNALAGLDGAPTLH